MGRNTVSYHLSALPILLVFLAFSIQCSNSQSLSHFLFPQMHATIGTSLVPTMQHLYNLNVKQHNKTTIDFKSVATSKQLLMNPDRSQYGQVSYITQQISSNYAGYAAQETDGSSFTNITGSWIMPSIQCATHETSEAAFWVGLTGQSQQNTIAQIATLGICQGGQVRYEADWELFPALAQTIPHTIQPGDMISAGVSYTGGQFYLTLQDSQQNWSFSVNRPGSTISATVAECITEAPTLVVGGTQRSITNLANFDQVNITCQADNASIGSYGQLSQYQMIAENATASPSTPNNSDSSFNVTWQGK